MNPDIIAIWSKFLKTGNDAEIVQVLEDIPAKLCRHEFPYRHRIGDFEIRGKYYRLHRCITCETLFVSQIDKAVANVDTPGVPFDIPMDVLLWWCKNFDTFDENPDWQEIERSAVADK